MLSLTNGASENEASNLDQGKPGSAPSDSDILDHVKDVRTRRAERVRLARTCHHKLLDLAEDHSGSALAEHIDTQRKTLGTARLKKKIGKKQGSDNLVKLLVQFDEQLGVDDAEVCWDVRHDSLVDLLDYGGDLIHEPTLVFRRDLQRLIAELRQRVLSPKIGASCLHVAECISMLAFGISWIDVVRTTSGDQFLKSIIGGRIELDENVRWVSPLRTANASSFPRGWEVVEPDVRPQDLVVWLQAKTESSGNCADFRVPEGEEAERLSAAMAQIWHNR